MLWPITPPAGHLGRSEAAPIGPLSHASGSRTPMSAVPSTAAAAAGARQDAKNQAKTRRVGWDSPAGRAPGPSRRHSFLTDGACFFASRQRAVPRVAAASRRSVRPPPPTLSHPSPSFPLAPLLSSRRHFRWPTTAAPRAVRGWCRGPLRPGAAVAPAAALSLWVALPAAWWFRAVRLRRYRDGHLLFFRVCILSAPVGGWWRVLPFSWAHRSFFFFLRW